MKKVIKILAITLLLSSCSKDAYIRKDFELKVQSPLTVNGASLSFDLALDSDRGVTLSPFDIPDPKISNGSGDILVNGNLLTEEPVPVNTNLEITLVPTPGDGHKNFAFQLDNGPSKKFLNVQCLVEKGLMVFAAMSYTTNTRERQLVTNYEESIFKVDFYSIGSFEVFLDNGTDALKKVATITNSSDGLSYVTSSGGTEIFKYVFIPF